MFRLIHNTKAENPYFHEMISVHLYSMEELCYYMETNMFLIDESWAGEGLFSWLEKELHMSELAGNLRQTLRKTKDIFSCILMIFQASGNYSPAELKKIEGLLLQMQGKTNMERRKLRGDLFLNGGKYRQAAYTYMELLLPEYTRQMTEELQGDIWHNLGVVYARFFLFPEAAQMFAKAYQLRKNKASRQAYLFAMNYMDDSCPMEEQLMDLNFSVMKEVLHYLSEVKDDPEYYIERKQATQAANAFDWKSKQTELLTRWRNEYKLSSI